MKKMTITTALNGVMRGMTLSVTASALLLAMSFGTAQAQDETANTDSDATVSEDTQGKIKTQTITVKDRFGTIEEQRVQSMYSEIRYVPNGSDNGYNLIEATGSNGTVNSEHSTNDDDLKIPSWNLFSW